MEAAEENQAERHCKASYLGFRTDQLLHHAAWLSLCDLGFLFYIWECIYLGYYVSDEVVVEEMCSRFLSEMVLENEYFPYRLVGCFLPGNVLSPA